MADLRANPKRIKELVEHLIRAEGAKGKGVPYFYCDTNRLVTIGVGYLVDCRGGSDTIGQQLARQLAQRANIRFTRLSGGGTASVAEVVEDWKKVKTYGHNHLVRHERYATIAQLRLSEGSIRILLETTLRRYMDQLYHRRPFLLYYDERVAMAFVDVRYNAARIPLYGSRPKIQQMWVCLDPRSRLFDVARAVKLFEQIWLQIEFRNQGQEKHYRQRHRQRVQWFQSGLQAMGIANWRSRRTVFRGPYWLAYRLSSERAKVFSS